MYDLFVVNCIIESLINTSRFQVLLTCLMLHGYFWSLSSSVPLLLTKAKAGIMDIRETK